MKNLIQILLISIFFTKYTEQKAGCVRIYSKCYYKGTRKTICDRNLSRIPFEILSFKLAKNSVFLTYTEENFQGKKTLYQNSKSCLFEQAPAMDFRARTTSFIPEPVISDFDIQSFKVLTF